MQGSGAATPVLNQQVTVRGVVVGDVPGFSGFYLQDPDGDQDPSTSDGIFVFSPVAVDLGDTVAVTGAAQEFGGQTQINSQQDVDVCAEGADLPAPAPLDLPADDAARERLEGMLVDPVDTPDRERGPRPHLLRRAHAVRGRPAGAADRARPPRHRRGRRHRGGEHAAPDRPGRRRERAGRRERAALPDAQHPGARR